MTPRPAASPAEGVASPVEGVALPVEGVASPASGASPVWGVALLLALFGLALRLAHNAALLESPLYWHPLGGHVVFLKTARAIVAGDWLPGSRPFVENSPLYPYVLALGWRVFGEDLLLTRLATILADAATVALVTVLAWRHFGRAAGIAAGLLYALYAPAIFFAGELIYTSYAVLLSTLAVLLVERERRRAALAAGLAAGLAIGLMPSLILLAPLLVAVPLLLRGSRTAARAALVAAGLAAAVLPITAANWVNSGQLVLLTTSAGHNFYVGHNPLARAGYHLPNRIGPVTFSNRGSIFDNMKAVAATIEGRELADAEVSGWFFRKGLAHVRADPGFELKLLLARLAALANAYEATTYADFYFQRGASPVLGATLTFELLLPFALIGMLWLRPRRHVALLAPLLVGVASVLLFFFLSRFRMPMIPILCVFAGQGLAATAVLVRRRAWRPTAAVAGVAVAVLVFARVAWVGHDSANEWNKVGAVWMSLGRMVEAEDAFGKARAENPRDPSAYLNLARLSERRGDAADAAALRDRAAALLPGAEGAAFLSQLSPTAPEDR